MSARVPEPLQQDTIEARIVKDKIWDRLWVKNEHFMGAIVGREGSGKSYTGLKLAEVVDPTFIADRVMFDPKAFVEHLKEWKAKNETQGKMVVADEAGVGLGVRTWYEKDQIKFNQVLQVIRDENMGMLFTLPRLSELDSQARGRLHAFIEMTEKEADEWAQFKWLNWDPTRDERDKTYRQYPEYRIGGVKTPVKRLCVSPPSQKLIEEYERRKSAFQAELYDETIDEMTDDEVEELGPKEIANLILDDGGVDEYLKQSNNGREYWDKELIEMDYPVSARQATKVKKQLVRVTGRGEG